MLLAATIFSIFLHITVAAESNVSIIYEYPETQIDTSYPGRDNTKLVFVRCNSSLPKVDKRCVVTMRVDAFEDTPGEISECAVNLKPESPYGFVNDSVQVYVFGRDKVLLIWTETQIKLTILKTSVVHMLAGCRTFETKVYKYLEISNKPIAIQYINAVLFENTYELIVEDLEDNCTSQSECELNYRLYKFDDRGRKVCGTEHWPKPPFNATHDYTFVRSAELREPDEAYFISNINMSTTIVELMNRKSSGYQKMQIWMDSCSSWFMEFRFSLVNEAIGFCNMCANRNENTSRFTCCQSDQKGHIHSQTQFLLDYSRQAYLSTVYNLRNGGLLLALHDCSESYCFTNDKFFFLQVDVKNNINSIEFSFHTQCYEDDNEIITRILENKQGQYCFVRLCKSKRNKPARLETSVRCFSNDEFSECTKCL